MDNKAKKRFIIVILILFFCLLLLLTMLLGALDGEVPSNVADSSVGTNIVDETSTNTTKPKTIEQIIAEYKSQYLSRSGNEIYIKFNKDLYDDAGNSNEKYFEAFIYDLAQIFLTSNFKLIDEEKSVTVEAVYDSTIEKHKIIFNERENFYEESDGKSYIAVEDSEIIETSILFKGNDILSDLIVGRMYFSSVAGLMGEYKELDSGYRYFPDHKIKMRLAPNDGVMNIVFTEDYEGNILHDVPNGTNLNKIYQLHPDNSSGSVSEGYLGYRNDDYYYFFYDDEVSVYGYLYAKNKVFENAVEEYLETKDLEKFYKTLSKKILSYDVLEYDPESQSLYMLLPTRGYEIDIEGNNPKGITLYNSYYFTDTSRQWVKDGYVKFVDKDLVQIYEKDRRNANEN